LNEGRYSFPQVEIFRCLNLPRRIDLEKGDAEGHGGRVESKVINGRTISSIMALSSKEKTLVDRVRAVEDRWRVARWLCGIVLLAIPAGGYFLRHFLLDHGLFDSRIVNSLIVLYPMSWMQLMDKWNGNVTNQLLVSVAERMDAQDDAKQ
jgi:hypothetical protein